MKASGIEINGNKRIKVEFPYDKETVSLIKEIKGARWSQTMKTWHIPYNRDAFEQLIKSFPEIEYPWNGQDASIKSQISKPDAELIGTQNRQDKNVSVQVLGRSIILKLPKMTLTQSS